MCPSLSHKNSHSPSSCIPIWEDDNTLVTNKYVITNCDKCFGEKCVLRENKREQLHLLISLNIFNLLSELWTYIFYYLLYISIMCKHGSSNLIYYFLSFSSLSTIPPPPLSSSSHNLLNAFCHEMWWELYKW